MKAFSSRALRALHAGLARSDGVARPRASLALRALARLAPALGDPLVTVELHGRRLTLPLSHDLAAIRARLPDYAEAVGRLAAAVWAADPHATMVDVGANVGDTVAIVRGRVPMPILCVEGSDAYHALLRENLADVPDVVLVHALLAGPAQVHGTLRHGRGSAHALGGQGDGARGSVTLDGLLPRTPPFHRALRLLKIDTDGMDGVILRGADSILRERGPVLFLEYDPRTWLRFEPDPFGIFAWLAQRGYRRFLFYDNEGWFFASHEADERRALLDLHYAIAAPERTRYYDVVAFAEPDAALAERFVTEERALYASRYPPAPG